MKTGVDGLSGPTCLPASDQLAMAILLPNLTSSETTSHPDWLSRARAPLSLPLPLLDQLGINRALKLEFPILHHH
jgi:hypothetical protein